MHLDPLQYLFVKLKNMLHEENSICHSHEIYLKLECNPRLEKVKLKSMRSQAKVVGTLATVAGAMIMTLIKGPILDLFGTHASNTGNLQNGGVNLQHAIKGSVMITIGCFSCACFMILQVSYHNHLSLLIKE